MQRKKDFSLCTTSIVRVVIGAAPQDELRNHHLLRNLIPIGAILVIALYLLIPLILLLHVVAAWLFSLIGAAAFLALIEALMIITLMRIDSVESPSAPRLQGQSKSTQPAPYDAKAVVATIAPRLKLPAYSCRGRAWPGIKSVVVDVPRPKLPMRG